MSSAIIRDPRVIAAICVLLMTTARPGSAVFQDTPSGAILLKLELCPAEWVRSHGLTARSARPNCEPVGMLADQSWLRSGPQSIPGRLGERVTYQDSYRRHDGGWWSVLVGGGFNMTAGVDQGTRIGGAMSFSAGGTANSHVLIGGEAFTWLRGLAGDVPDETLTLHSTSSIGFGGWFFPRAHGRLFAKLLLSAAFTQVSWYNATQGQQTEWRPGTGAAFGIGYHVPFKMGTSLVLETSLLVQQFEQLAGPRGGWNAVVGALTVGAIRH